MRKLEIRGKTEMPLELNNILDVIESFSNPISIFLYGSRAREDYLNDSDYEIGVLYEKGGMIHEKELHSRIQVNNKFRIYSYEYDLFMNHDINVPFEVNIFLRIIALVGKTLRGKHIIEKMEPPSVTVVSLLREIKFQLGRASDAVVCFRQGWFKFSAELFYKSCLWATRDLIILTLRKFPVSYIDIVEMSKELDLKEFDDIVMAAYESRLSGTVSYQDLLRNIWYMNQFIERRILDYYKKEGDSILV